MTPPSPVPVLLAAMNPAMLRLAGRAADGVFITWTPPGEVASLVGDDTVHALCAIGSAETVADYVRALRAAGVVLPVVLTPGAGPGDVAGPRATITALAAALGLSARPSRRPP